MSQNKLTKIGSIAALLTSGVIAGGILAGTNAASAADSGSGTATAPPAAGSAAPRNPHAGDPTKSQRRDEKLLTGTDAEKAKAAALAKYPGATVQRVETDSDGVYEAHLLKADGTPVTVEMGKDFVVTGEETRGGPPPAGAPMAG